MLQEQDRSKLDGIVQQMQSNNESDDYIQNVVNDFKSKYDKPSPEGFLQQTGNFLKSRFQNLQNVTGLGQNDLTPKAGGGYTLNQDVAKRQNQAIAGFLNPESGALGLKTGLESLAPKLMKSAEQDVGKILQPTTKNLKSLTQKITPEFVQKAPVFSSLGGLLSKAESKLNEFGQMIGEKLDALPPETKDKLQPILKRITQAQNNLSIKGTDIIPGVNEAQHQALSNFKNELVNIARSTQDIPTNSLKSYLSELDKSLAKAGKGFGYSPADTAKLTAQKTLANAIRDEMAKARPDLAQINKEYTFWKRVQTIGQATLERKTGQVGGLRGPISGAGGAAAGAAAGASTGIPGASEVGAFAGSFVGKQLQKIFDSAGYARLSIGLKKQAADFIASGKVRQAVKILNKSVINFRTPSE